MTEKEVHFSEKKVDESWKETATKAGQNVGEKAKENEPKANDLFRSLITSLAMQALVYFGEIQMPGTETKGQLNLEAAKETIDLLVMIKEKTEHNRTAEEEQLITSILADLQLKFVQLSR